MLKWMYNSKIGRLFLKILTRPTLSKIVGAFLDCKISIIFIPLFIITNKINLEEVEHRSWKSFNDFFTRELKAGSRKIESDSEDFISPCDGLLTVDRIKKGRVFSVKGSNYTVADLLNNKTIAKTYEGGYAFIYRLTPSHYHRYAYPETGLKSRTVKIPGILHTVKPIATEATDVFVQNSREYCIIKTKEFGPLAFMQVGAMLVGRITNKRRRVSPVIRGEEAGYFEFGGSTIIVLVKKGKVKIDRDIKKASLKNEEFPVKLGMRVGKKK